MRVASLLVVFALLPAGLSSQTRPVRVFTNLQVLPKDISDDELSEIMLDNLRGLGLPRLAGGGCLFCHVGDLERPRSTWDYASDEKPMKAKARVMMAMVREINGAFLPKLEHRIASDTRVTCHSCHKGRTDPRPLPDLLRAADSAGGVDSVKMAYRALRERYFGGDAFDFRRGVLEAIALEVADRGRIDDAVALVTLEREANPNDPAAGGALVRIELERAIARRGVRAALEELEVTAAGLGPDVLVPGLLDQLVWRIFRKDRKEEARAIAAANLARFPNEYIPNESTAFLLRDAGDRAGAIRLLEDWLTSHPDHARARRLLINMRGR